MESRRVMEHFLVSRGLLFLLVMVGLYGVMGCGGSSSPKVVDGDEECQCDPPCPDGWVCFECKCYNIDGDTTPPDGDTSESDGDADVDNVIDGDVTEDGDVEEDSTTDGDIEPPPDGDIEQVDVEPDIPSEWEEAGDSIRCDPIYSPCPPGYYCAQDGECYVDEGDGDIDSYDWDLEEGAEICLNGMPACDDHTDCPRAIPCNPDSGCCDTNYLISCITNSDCYFGSHCTALGYCDFECLKDEHCALSEYCDDRGFCQLRYNGDEDEEELPPCTSCADCLDWFGEGYYCNMDLVECLPKPSVDGCCESSECTRQPNGICNRHIGKCVYFPDATNRGAISGHIHIPYDACGESLTYQVEMENAVGDVIEIDDGLLPVEGQGGDCSAVFGFDRLVEGSYYLYAKLELGGFVRYAYPFNPVTINFDTYSTTIIEDADIFIEMDDPRLGSISGSVSVNGEYDRGSLEGIAVYRENQGNRELELVTVVGLDDSLDDGEATFRVTNLNSGSYLVFAEMDMGDVWLRDYHSELIEIDLDANPAQAVEDVNFYFGPQDDALGSVSGHVYFADWFDPDTLEVAIFNWFDYPYAVGEAWFTDWQPNSVAYSIQNLERGTFWILGSAGSDGIVASQSPGISTIDVEEGVGVVNDYSGRDIYLDVPQPNFGSISGTIFFADDMDDALFSIELHQNGSMIIEDPVVAVDVSANQALYFVEKLDAGTYTIKAVAKVLANETILEYPSSIEVEVEPGSKDVSQIDFDFTE